MGLTVSWEVNASTQINEDTKGKIFLPCFPDSVFISEFSGEISALGLLFPDTKDDALSEFVHKGNSGTKRTDIFQNE